MDIDRAIENLKFATIQKNVMERHHADTLVKHIHSQQAEIDKLKADKMRMIIEKAKMSLEIERLKGEGWISVEDRLPKHEEEVTMYSEVFDEIHNGMYLANINRWVFNGDINDCVTHWHPLLKAPEVID